MRRNADNRWVNSAIVPYASNKFLRCNADTNNNNKYDTVTGDGDIDAEDNGFVILPSKEQKEEKEEFVLLPKEVRLVVQEQPNYATCSKIEQLETFWSMTLEAKNDLVYAITDIYHDSITKENLGFQLQQGLYKLQDFWEQDVKGVWRCALWIKNEIAAMS
ncbi:hypothetical protein INT45_003170 [Circinella minor]|uniref:Uncharacterized protein n=1 Tax=Circinella minor TaxID=1195481 RepID=A0A8H7RTC7_9FUNG|nr:hypothetical protein INT45_003170 [Circinella minor]